MPVTEPIALPSGGQLRELTKADAADLLRLKLANRARLTRFGDWTIPDDYSVEDVIREFDDDQYPKRSFGIATGDKLVGVVSLTAVTSESWSIGYFLDAEATGHGLATRACRAALPIATEGGAAELYGVVTHGNDASNAVLRRAGFSRLQITKRSTRWWMPLRPDPEPPTMQVYAVQRGFWTEPDGNRFEVDVVEIGFRHEIHNGQLRPVIDDASNTVPITPPLFYGRAASADSALTPFTVLEPACKTVRAARAVVEAAASGAVEWAKPSAN